MLGGGNGMGVGSAVHPWSIFFYFAFYDSTVYNLSFSVCFNGRYLQTFGWMLFDRALLLMTAWANVK